MIYPYARTSTNCPCGGETISNPHVSLPINCPIPLWPINHPISGWPINILAWPHNHLNEDPALRYPTSASPVNITDTISNSWPNQVVCPWPLYTSDLAPFLGERVRVDLLDSVVNTAAQLGKMHNQTHKVDLAVDKLSHDSSEQARNDRLAHNNDLIVSVLSEQIVKQNIVTDVKVTEDMITVYISPVISATYVRPDCQNPTTVNRYDSDPITVQGLGKK